MKILFITSFYSALKESVMSNDWNPSGMPAIVKLFEGLKKRTIDFESYFVDRSSNNDECLKIQNKMFNNEVKILKVSKKLNVKFLRSIGESYNSFLIYKKIKRTCQYYDVIYVDRANLVIGAFFAFTGKKVVLRLHGVTDFYENYSKLYFRLMNPLKLLCLRAPFDYIICSEDGSPGKQFLKKYTKAKFNITLLNGVDDVRKKRTLESVKKDLSIKEGIPIFLFLSRLSKDKGILEFIKGVVEIQKQGLIFHTVIVGAGKYYKIVKEIIDNEKLENISLTGAVKHSDVYTYFQLCDVYVSLNMIGNLSNTVLEAVNAGKCIITLDKSRSPLRDISTYDFFNTAAIFLNRDNINEELKKVITRLIKDPALIEDRKKEIINCQSKLQTWSQRIDVEINYITNEV